ncbi:DUF2306 domain-containing protein [Acidovorax sp. Leaf78]|uniref:DUF2306 domain-containing protein n=1 Tax=unclassified Acidovorax TaxID=2684926 RepID=UPI0007007678|nr:DUF2306 domain-containing protein [Acidovorax sp. Leaf78]KQO19418.1 hypothetical protein ASF16_12190 [Acidovorax sp. Leaf78]RZJ48445.1 MAG: DUF2306 domain-containing protein [Acidovorax sp.]
MQLTPVIAIHAAAALAAIAIGPVALWARKGATQRPRLHRAAGYAWVTLMVATAISAIFITGGSGPRWGSFGLIHLLIPVTLGMLVLSFVYLARRNIAGHRKAMQRVYFGACVVAGAFTLLPDRLLGHSLWTQLGVL